MFGLLALSSGASALESTFVGPRATAMGGAGVACVDDYTAQYYNPAWFGFFSYRDSIGHRVLFDNADLGRKIVGLGVDVGVGERQHGDLGAHLTTLSNIDIEGLSTNGVMSEQDVSDLVKAANALGHLDDPGNGQTIQLTAGLGMRVGHFGFGVRTIGEVAVVFDSVDITHLGVAINVATLNAQMAANGGPSNGVQLFTPAQVSQLQATGLSNAAIDQFDYQARQNGVTPAQSQDAVNLLAGIANGSNAGAFGLSNNTTSVLVTAFDVVEAPITYGYAINDRLSLGANLKLMVGTVFGQRAKVFQDTTDAVDQVKSSYHRSFNIGVDVGLAFRMRHLQLGITGRNLNSPTFEGFSGNGVVVPRVRLDPQVTVGAALVPWTTFTIACDCDLTSQPSMLTGYDTQMLSLGAEWNIWHTLALRAGMYKNLAESDIEQVLTAGVGLNLWLARVDVAAAYSPQTTDLYGQKIPKEARFDLGVAIDF